MFTKINYSTQRESQLQQEHQNYAHTTTHTAVHYNNKIITAGSERLYAMVFPKLYFVSSE